MPDNPPFMNAYGLIPKILAKIKEAKTPARFTQDFLATNLGFPGGSAKPFVSFAKRVGLLSSDGTPTDIYNSFRNPHYSKGAMARAVKTGYAQLYERNEYTHKLDKPGLQGLIIQATGLDRASGAVKSIIGSFEALKSLADFDAADQKEEAEPKPRNGTQAKGENAPQDGEVKMNLAYTINLNLPKTDDIAVFNAIFKALHENLLKK
jgi:uncharacterized protein DUF5343